MVRILRRRRVRKWPFSCMTGSIELGISFLIITGIRTHTHTHTTLEWYASKANTAHAFYSLLTNELFFSPFTDIIRNIYQLFPSEGDPPPPSFIEPGAECGQRRLWLLQPAKKKPKSYVGFGRMEGQTDRPGRQTDRQTV